MYYEKLTRAISMINQSLVTLPSHTLHGHLMKHQAMHHTLHLPLAWYLVKVVRVIKGEQILSTLHSPTCPCGLLVDSLDSSGLPVDSL